MLIPKVRSPQVLQGAPLFLGIAPPNAELCAGFIRAAPKETLHVALFVFGVLWTEFRNHRSCQCEILERRCLGVQIKLNACFCDKRGHPSNAGAKSQLRQLSFKGRLNIRLGDSC